MKSWVDAVKKELSLDVSVDVEALLDIARVAAHTIERPAAPVTTYLLGIAVAHGFDFNEACQKIDALAKEWPEQP